MLCSDTWKGNLEESLHRDREFLRPELASGLDGILSGIIDANALEQFAEHNPTVSIKAED